MSVNIESLLKDIKAEIIPFEKEYRESLALSNHLDDKFKNYFNGKNNPLYRKISRMLSKCYTSKVASQK